MLTTSHALMAGVILKAIPDPKIALPLAFISHFVLDLVPHWDLMTERGNGNAYSTLAKEKNLSKLAFWATMEMLFGVGLTFWLFQNLNPLILLTAILVAQLPDWIEMPYLFWGIKFTPSILVKRFQSRTHSRLSLPWGLVIQIVIFLPLLWWTLH